MLIVFEGIDGAGKSTQAQLLLNYLNEAGRAVRLTGPFLTEYGKAVRKIFMEHSETDMETQILLLASAMSQLAAEIRSAAKNEIVILDRYIYTTYAYHGESLGVDIEKIKRIYEPAIQGVLPDYVILLDMPPAITRKRIFEARDRIESFPEDFYLRARQGYLKMAASDPCFVILDATKSAELVHDEVVNLISRKVHLRFS